MIFRGIGGVVITAEQKELLWQIGIMTKIFL